MFVKDSIQPLLSICIPTYNRAKHIKRLYKFFINELNDINNSEVEIIISNNASTDNTKDFLEQITDTIPIKIFHQKNNIGALPNFRFLLHKATGKYFWMPGDDDYLKKGIVKEILDIIRNNDLSYIHIRRFNIIEKNKNISIINKFKGIEYDKIIKVKHKNIVDLLKYNFGDLKFQTSAIFKRKDALIFDSESLVFPINVQEDCHTLYKAFRAMQKGTSYFFSDVKILSGDEILWKDKAFDYIFFADACFCDYTVKFGITDKERNEIKDIQYAKGILASLVNIKKFQLWRKHKYPGLSYNVIFVLITLVAKGILKKIRKGMNKYIVNPQDFYVCS